MRTFSIQTLGCKVNQYESDQIATLLRARGLVQIDSAEADLRIINTCSVTVQAASKSRQLVRRVTRLHVLQPDFRLPIADFRMSQFGNWQSAIGNIQRTIVTG